MLVGSLWAVLPTASPAQGEPGRDSPPQVEIRCRLGNNGSLRLDVVDAVDGTPLRLEDPFDPDPEAIPYAFDPLSNSAWSQVIPFALLFAIAPGDTDLLGLTDADRFFALLGTDDAELLQRIGGSLDDPLPGAALRRRLAIRAASQRGFRPALGLLDRIGADAAADPELRRAAQRAAVQLRGGTVPQASVADQLDLGSLLAQSPLDATVFAVIDQHRLPNTSPLAGWVAYLARVSLLNAYSGRNEPFAWAMLRRAWQVDIGSRVMGYELVKRFGNHRVDRTFLAFAPSSEPPGAGWPGLLVHQGEFDVAAVERGLQQYAIDHHRGDDGTLYVSAGDPDGFAFEIAPSRLVLRSGPRQSPRLTAEVADAIARILTAGSAPVVACRNPAWELDEGARRFAPTMATLSVPKTPGGDVVLTSRFENDAAARAVTGVLRGLPRMVQQLIDDEPKLDPMLDLSESLRITTADDLVTITLPWPELDLEAFLTGLGESGLLR